MRNRYLWNGFRVGVAVFAMLTVRETTFQTRIEALPEPPILSEGWSPISATVLAAEEPRIRAVAALVASLSMTANPYHSWVIACEGLAVLEAVGIVSNTEEEFPVLEGGWCEGRADDRERALFELHRVIALAMDEAAWRLGR